MTHNSRLIDNISKIHVCIIYSIPLNISLVRFNHHEGFLYVSAWCYGWIPWRAPLWRCPRSIKITYITPVKPPPSSIDGATISITLPVVVLIIRGEEHAWKVSVIFSGVFCTHHTVTLNKILILDGILLKLTENWYKTKLYWMYWFCKPWWYSLEGNKN